MAQNPFEKQVGVSQTLSHWHQREPDKGGGNNHAGNTAPPVEIQPPFGYRAHWVFAYFHREEEEWHATQTALGEAASYQKREK